MIANKKKSEANSVMKDLCEGFSRYPHISDKSADFLLIPEVRLKCRLAPINCVIRVLVSKAFGLQNEKKLNNLETKG